MKASEAIRKAIQLIKDRGWVDGTWEDERGCLCLEGALNVALGHVHDNGYPRNDDPIDEPGREVYEAMYGVIDHGVEPLYLFNDRQTTREPVLRKMGQAARRLEKEGR